MSGATNKITALYCRLSQEDARVGESLSIENQKMILIQYAKEHRFPNPTFFVDDGYSGTNFDRPGFQAMLAEIEAGRVAVCCTKDLSRLGRNSSLTGLYINFTFPKYNVRYIAINDHFDTIAPNSTDSDIAGIKNWFNEFYARDTSRKIRAVNKAKGERGVPLTVHVPYGYVKDPADKHHWIVDEETAAVVKRIFDLCMEGRGPQQIANQLKADKVLTPTAYKKRQGQKTPHAEPERTAIYRGEIDFLDVIAFREDVYDLIRQHTPPKQRAENGIPWEIMEAVGKGKYAHQGMSDEVKRYLSRTLHLPGHYINAMKRIEYLPKKGDCVARMIKAG